MRATIGWVCPEVHPKAAPEAHVRELKHTVMKRGIVVEEEKG